MDGVESIEFFWFVILKGGGTVPISEILRINAPEKICLAKILAIVESFCSSVHIQL